MAKTQICPAPLVSTLRLVAGVNTMPCGASHGWLKFHERLVLAAIDNGPIKFTTGAPALTPSPIVTVRGLDPQFMVKESMTMLNPAPGAAFKTSQPEASALTAFRRNPKRPTVGFVTVMAMCHLRNRRGRCRLLIPCPVKLINDGGDTRSVPPG